MMKLPEVVGGAGKGDDSRKRGPEAGCSCTTSSNHLADRCGNSRITNSLGLSKIGSIGFVQLLAGAAFFRGTAFDGMELTCRHRMTDLEFDLTVHLSGDFDKKPPPLGFVSTAGHVPLPGKAANSVMRVFDPDAARFQDDASASGRVPARARSMFRTAVWICCTALRR